ncbi:tetratricopeptide repeat protein [Pseudogracilibacillus auburnensis]|uniref:tetratricopeptide repeat protein n=1 Tax=Pseudogracilibacillus auburnensis TaxID=1494959 RepID=UPI001A95CF93|nr:tetratricopeptide repeat protein [Pseudogracilibacillus auburnensis]MBO1003716.1 tetratricopeptide repeat protein [Pseudogracilibacillus auburnensis]
MNEKELPKKMKKMFVSMFAFIMILSGCSYFLKEDPLFSTGFYAEEYYNEGNYHEALEHVNKRLKRYPKDPYLLNEKGLIYIELKEYEKALDVLDQALQFDEKIDSIYNNKSVAYNELGRFEEAIDQAKKAIDLKPDAPEEFINMGNALLNLDRYEESLTYFELALDLEPEEPISFYGQGASLYFLNEYDEAKESFTKYLEKVPDDIDAFWYFVHIHEELEEYESAIEYLDQIIASSEGEDYDALNYKGVFLSYIDEMAESLEVYEHLAEQYPDDGYIFYGKAIALINLDKTKKGLNVLEQAIDLEPSIIDWAYEDPLLEKVSNHKRFVEMMELD